jgi:hypothetical protein
MLFRDLVAGDRLAPSRIQAHLDRATPLIALTYTKVSTDTKVE